MISWWVLCAAWADVEPDERWLSTDWVAVGLAADGSLANTEADLGLLFDPDGPEGPFPLGGDVILPGRDFELWSLSTAEQSWVNSSPHTELTPSGLLLEDYLDLLTANDIDIVDRGSCLVR